MAVAAPVIVAEMNDWVALGGGNSGITGDRNHSYGFHLAANEVGPDDYSRWRDPQGADGPYVDWDYACAGDFSHRGDEKLRELHRNVLARLMRGELAMIAEFIGQPFASEPVYYWARWLGVTKLQRYTGSGHDHWSHISWYRSMADQRAHLWTPTQEEDMQFIRQADGGIWRVVGEDPATWRPIVYPVTGEQWAEWQHLNHHVRQLPGPINLAHYTDGRNYKPLGAAVDLAAVRKVVAEELAKDPGVTAADVAQVAAAAEAAAERGAAAALDDVSVTTTITKE